MKPRLVTRLLLALLLAAMCGPVGARALADDPVADPNVLAPPANSNVLLQPASPDQVFSGGPGELPSDAWVEVGPNGFSQDCRRPSWCAKPLYVDLLTGPIEGSALESGKVRQDRVGIRAGFGFGCDIGSHWGIEKHFGYAALRIADQDHTDRRTSTALFGEFRGVFYPLGDKPFRPYLTTGLGLADFEYRDSIDEHHRRGAFLIPYGAGVKYLFSDRFALRAEIIDDFTIGTNHLAPMHNVSLLGGIEVRFAKPKLPKVSHGKTTCRWLWQ